MDNGFGTERRIARNSSVLASHTVQVTSEAKASPTITAFTTRSEFSNMPQGERSSGNSALLIMRSPGNAAAAGAGVAEGGGAAAGAAEEAGAEDGAGDALGVGGAGLAAAGWVVLVAGAPPPVAPAVAGAASGAVGVPCPVTWPVP